MQEGMPGMPSGRVRGAPGIPGPAEVPGVGEGCAESLWDAVCPQPGDPGHSVTVEGVGAGQGGVNAVISRGRGSPTDEASPARWEDSSAARRGHKGGSPGSSWSQGRG